jgi:glucokinase
MLVSLGTDTKKVRTVNRLVVLNLIRESGPLSKAAIARQTGRSLSTINRVIEELLSEELIQPASDQLERGSGRPGEVFEFTGRSHHVIGIDLGYPNLRGMIADLSGRIHNEVAVPAAIGDGNENYRRLLVLLDRLEHESNVEFSQISGIGLGVAGTVDHSKGIVLRSASMGWENFPLAKRLFKDTGLTLYLESDINLITLGEYGFGVGQGISNLVCITLGTRVLCGIIINGEIYNGSNFNSGRIDEFISTGDYHGNLESLISSPSIIEAARKQLVTTDPLRAESLNDAKQVYQAATAGEAWAQAIISERIPALAMTLSNISMLLDPEMIVFSGRMAEDSELLIPKITNYLKDRVPCIPLIQKSNLGTQSTVLGAIMLVYNGILHNW